MAKFSGSGRQRDTSPWPGGGGTGSSPQGSVSPPSAAGTSKSSSSVLFVAIAYLLWPAGLPLLYYGLKLKILWV